MNLLPVDYSSPSIIKQVALSSFTKLIERCAPALLNFIKRHICFDLFAQARASVDYVERKLDPFIFIRRLLPTEIIGVEMANCFCDSDARDDWLKRASVGYVNLNAAAKLALEFVKSRLEMKRTEDDSGQLLFL